MKNLNFSHRIITAIMVLLIVASFSCKKKSSKELMMEPAYNSAISAFTSGVISSESTIQIRFSEEYAREVETNQLIEQNIFSFKPRIKGAAFWIDSRTIEFRPDEKLRSGEVITAKLNLSKVIDVTADLANFSFQFQIIEQDVYLKIEGYETYNNRELKLNKILGSVETADVMDDEAVEQILSAVQNKQKLKISWIHADDQKSHRFQIDSVIRADDKEEVLISWNGKDIGIDKKGKEKVEIPSLGEFTLLSSDVVQQPQQYILLKFSDPLNPKQNLRGLIRLENNTSLSYTIDGNKIMAYPNVRQTGDTKLYVEEGIKNVLNYPLKEKEEIDVSFYEIKPSVKLIGKGVILPNSNGLIFPFEAVNLKAVDVKIVKIFENNIGYFLQVNKLDGNNQLKRAGRLVYKKTIRLKSDKPIDYGRRNTFSLDLAELIKADPGAIYRIELGFKKKYSLYSCANEDEEESQLEEMEENWDEDLEQEMSYWDNFGSYYNDYYYDDYYNNYNWRDRDDPCTESYYGERRSVSRNILASNLGMIAKIGNDKSITIAITDLVSTTPLSGVKVEVLNFQQQVMASAETDGKGIVELDVKYKPFLIIAKYGDQRGYLKLDDGSSLSVSRFDVSGERVEKGIKGTIYAERGVWRPGDTLFTIFVLEDKKGILPERHPVSFELINPQGQVVKKMLKSKGINGFYNFTCSTSPDAPTGNWLARVKVGGVVFTKPLQIETIKPNRLKINIDFGREKIYSDEQMDGKISVKWLHGAIAKNLRVQVSVHVSQVKTSFKKYTDYIFDDPVRRVSTNDEIIFDQSLDDQGMASITSRLSFNRKAPGMLNAHFVTRAFEESGDFSSDRYTIPYVPYKTFIGVKLPKGDRSRGMLLTDTNHVVNVVTLDADGKPVSVNNLEVKVYKLNWRWWWDNSSENLASFSSSSNHTVIHKDVISTKNGKGKFTFRVDYPDWGRYMVRVTDNYGGHATGKVVYIDWPGWAGRSQRDNPGGAAMLTFNADKEKYKVGETAFLTIPSSGKGRALVTIESGSKVLKADWIEITQKEVQYSFKITREMSPNVYANVTIIQPHAQVENDLPMRLYGLVPLLVEDPLTLLEPEISMPNVLLPESKFTLKVKEKNNKSMTYTIAVVDEGLLDLTRFKTPDLRAKFYAREALGVKTWDIYDMVIGAYGGKIEQLFSIGGGEDSDEGSSKQAIRFKPVVTVLGPFTYKGGTDEHTISLPQYIGSVRTMVVAGYENAYGMAEKTTPVRKPLMVLATMPRVLGPGETVKIPVTIFAMEKNIKNVSVEIKPNSLFTSVGSNKQTLQFDQPGDEIVNFELKVASKIGIGRVKIIAKSGSEISEYDVELNVRNPNPPIVKFVDAVIESGKNWDTEFNLPGIVGTNKATLEVSTLPPIDFGRRLKYLLSYPHGCIEQTTSAAFPQLFIEDVMDVSDEVKNKAKENVKKGLERLNKFMQPNGGFGYWPGSSSASDWGTSYAGHFMLEAEKKGFALPVGMKKNWLKYQRKQARRWNSPSYSSEFFSHSRYDLAQAYRLYTLALAGETEFGAMNRLKEKSDLSLQGKWRLAATYALSGKPEVSKQITKGLGHQIVQYSGSSYTYGSSYRDMAMILETMILNGDRTAAFPLMKEISTKLSAQYWMSTQTTAYCLLAVSKFAGEAASKEMKYSYEINGGSKTNAATKLPLSQIELDVKNKLSGTIKMTNSGSGIIYARVIMEGVPGTDDLVEDIENNLKLSITYTDMNGYAIDVNSLEQGTDFIAKVTVYNPSQLSHYSDMALTQIFPSGWEIHNTRMDGNEALHRVDIPKYMDIRDDRVYTYFDLRRGKSKTFVVLLNASYLGKFYLPSVYCETMYDNTINARKPGKWIEVVKP